MSNKLFIKQDGASGDALVACRLVTDDDPQVQLSPGQWVKVAECDSGNHVLRVGTMLNSGSQMVTLDLKGATHNGGSSIQDLFHAPTDGNRYEMEVSDD